MLRSPFEPSTSRKKGRKGPESWKLQGAAWLLFAITHSGMSFFSLTYKSTWNIPEQFSQHHKDGIDASKKGHDTHLIVPSFW